MSSFLFGLLYFAPIIVGLLRRSGNLPMLLLLNVLLGWTVVGWLFAWTFVFPTLNALFIRTLLLFLPKGAVQALPGQPRPAPGGTDAPRAVAPCATCGGGGTQTCSSCAGRGSWYEQPQTATDVAQLRHCGACTSSGRVRCVSCGGSGRSPY
jgi:hypothetical protein